MNELSKLIVDEHGILLLHLYTNTYIAVDGVNVVGTNIALRENWSANHVFFT